MGITGEVKNLLRPKLPQQRFDFSAIAKIEASELDSILPVSRFRGPAITPRDAEDFGDRFFQKRLGQKTAGKPGHARYENSHGFSDSGNESIFIGEQGA